MLMKGAVNITGRGPQTLSAMRQKARQAEALAKQVCRQEKMKIYSEVKVDMRHTAEDTPFYVDPLAQAVSDRVTPFLMVMFL